MFENTKKNGKSENPYEDKIPTENEYHIKSNTPVRKANNNKKEEDYRNEISNMEFSS